jgi:hypothetical protein
MMDEELAVDPVVLREQVKTKYREVAPNRSGEYHFHTQGPLRGASVTSRRYSSRRLTLQVESFASVANL